MQLQKITEHILQDKNKNIGKNHHYHLFFLNSKVNFFNKTSNVFQFYFFLAIQGIFSLHVDDLSITSGESSEHLKHTGTTSFKILNHKRTFSRKGT